MPGRLQSKGSCSTFDEFTTLIFNTLNQLYETARSESFHNIWDNTNPQYDTDATTPTEVITNNEKYKELKDLLEGIGFTVAYPRNSSIVDHSIWETEHGESLIGYRLFSKRPSREIKPRVRERFRNPDNPDDWITIYGQLFNYMIEFEILADAPKPSEEFADRFEQFIFQFTGYFKESGITHLAFSNRTPVDRYVEKGVYGQRLIYSAILEDITEVHSDMLKKIRVITDAVTPVFEYVPPKENSDG